MYNDNSHLTIGISIDIQRTDGRIHSAVVSGVQDGSVTVEWFENGEAKGKEVDYESVYRFNDHLRPAHTDEAFSSLPLVDECPSLNGVSNLNNNSSSLPSAKIQAPLPQSSTAFGGISARLSTTTPAPAASATTSPQTTSRISRPSGCFLNGQHSLSNNATKVSLGGRQHAPVPEDNVPSPVQENTEWSEEEPNGDLIDGATTPLTTENSDYVSGTAGGGNAKRLSTKVQPKSSVVKEIERIQQRREERRANQHKGRENPTAENEPGNPTNYEFVNMIRQFQRTLEYAPLSVTGEVVNTHRICVCVRKRPLNKKELLKKEPDVVTIPASTVVYVHEPKLKVDLTKYLENQQFRFDFAFDETVDNFTVYRYTARPLVECVFEGGMATCFAYGQTGSGKTHTFGGEFQGKGQQDCSNGIYALAAKDMFQILKTKYKTENFYVEASFFEIYGGKVFDLLNKKQKLRVLEDGHGQVQVVGLKEEPIESPEDVKRLLQHGTMMRTSGQTSANQHSSRSHAVFQLKLKKRATRKLHGKFSLIDLAGNERGVDTSSADRITRMEGAEINKSLLCLKECIRALGRKGAHLPFRGSKLTQVLRDSFIGEKSRTCMIAMISPGMSSCEHSLNTLRYADRVKELAPGGNLAFVPSGDTFLPEEDDDVAEGQFGSLNDKDETMSDEYRTFQDKVAHIEMMEEEVCDQHQNVIEQFEQWHKEHLQLSLMSNEVDYDVEDFAFRLESLLSKEVEQLQLLKDKVIRWRSDLQEEEVISTQMQRHPQS